MGHVGCAKSIMIAPDFDVSHSTIYQRIRDDIVSGRLAPLARLKIGELAATYGTSTNPVREALQVLRGEGLVTIEPNRGARVVRIDEDFVRDICEIEMLIEPSLTRWFCTIASDPDIAELERIQDQIEGLNFGDPEKHGQLDTQFHMVIYGRHYNRHAADLWWRHREILRSIARKFPTSLSRRQTVVREHRELIEAIRKQDAEKAAAIVAQHVEGSGRHIIEQMRLARLKAPGSASA
ncbi:GntR family transcriptional regulator [Devosia sp. WQ 349]|nr:GntR family transcriptional regulator [Devosia sp. WQ 349K1]